MKYVFYLKKTMAATRKRQYGVVNCVESKLHHMAHDVSILRQYIGDATYIPVDPALYDDVLAPLLELASSYRIVKRAAHKEMPRDIWSAVAEHVTSIRELRLVCRRFNDVFSARVFCLNGRFATTIPKTLLSTFKNVRECRICNRNIGVDIFQQGRPGLKFVLAADIKSDESLPYCMVDLNGADLDIGYCESMNSMQFSGVRCLTAKRYRASFVKSAQCAVLPLWYCLKVNWIGALGTITAVFMEYRDEITVHSPESCNRFPSNVVVYMDERSSRVYKNRSAVQLFFSDAVVHLWDGVPPAFVQ